MTPRPDSTRIAVVGHVEWVDFVQVPRFPSPGEIVNAGGAFARAAGGGGVAAGVLAGLGASVDFFTALGRDELGSRAARELGDHGMRVHVAWRDDPTRRALTLLGPDGERTIVTIGDRLAALGADELGWREIGGADGVYFTAGDSSALARARAGRVLVVSPRARDALVGDESAIDAVVFSARDPDERAWAERVGARARLHVATDGARGGRWWGESSGSWRPAPPPGPVRDTYGCGDSFAAGFTLGLARGDTVEDAVAFGAELGARCVTVLGAP
jgi:ribokinase